MADIRYTVQPLIDIYQEAIDQAVLNWVQAEEAALECLTQFEELRTTPGTPPRDLKEVYEHKVALSTKEEICKQFEATTYIKDILTARLMGYALLDEPIPDIMIDTLQKLNTLYIYLYIFCKMEKPLWILREHLRMVR